MPGYMWGPSGGYRVVYEYANQLVARGHQISVVHPRRLASPQVSRPTLRQHARKLRLTLRELISSPTIYWHSMDPRVQLLYVPSLQNRYIPDGEVVFATAWNTAKPVMRCSKVKGEKAYLIQSYETWMGPKELVDETWRMPLRKVVISKWLLNLGKTLGARTSVYIPNGLDHDHYRVLQPIAQRPRQVVMVLSHVPLKGSKEGIAALELVKKQFPDLRAVLFGNSYRPAWVPAWMHYRTDPPQQEIVEQFYNSSSIMLSPSWTEGFGLPGVEAACCGCAIAATDNDGHREYVEHGVTGLLSPPKDPEGLARNLCTLLANDDLRIRLAHAANAFVQRYNWRHSTDLMEAFLTEAAKRKHVARQGASAFEVSAA